jgi:predicted SAM-dependent methyltransferase
MGNIYKFALGILRIPAGITRRILPSGALEQLSFEVRSSLGRRFAKRLKVNPIKANYLDLGAADTPGGNFVPIDFFGRKGIYGADLRYPLLIDDACIDGIFSEHTFEHLTFPEGTRLMAECCRVLKPGGRMRIIVPDVSIFAKRYVDRDVAWFQEWEEHVLRPRGRRMYTMMQAISFVTQEYGHRSAWDFESLQAALSAAGFVNIEQLGFGEGREPVLLRDRNLHSRILTSVYVEAEKPTAGDDSGATT